MRIKRILLLLAIAAVLAFGTGCDPKDGNTSGSAESNGVISDQSDDRTGSAADSNNLGDDLSDMISDAGDVVSDVVSDVEEGVSDVVSDLFGEDGSDAIG